MPRTRRTFTRPACCYAGSAYSCGGTCEYAEAEQERAETAAEYAEAAA